MIKNKRIVVTGGAGFIGSHIVDALIEAGNYVIVIDNLSTGNIKNIEHHLEAKSLKLKTDNSQVVIPELRQDRDAGSQYGEDNITSSRVTRKASNFEFVNDSITNLSLLQGTFKGVDYIFHEAGLASVPRSVADPIASNEVNINGTLNVLIAARDNKVKKVIYAASSSAYGDTPTLPKREDMAPNPLSPYAVTKLTAEYYCLVFNKVFGLPTACLRYFNVYGPRQDPNSQYSAVIPKFILRIMAGEAPVIFGNGEQSRDFTFVKDVVSANLLAAETQANGIFNVGRGEKITLNQLTVLLLEKLNRTNIKPEYEKTRIGDVEHSLADISRARSFGYNPQYDIEKGLNETIKSFGYTV